MSIIALDLDGVCYEFDRTARYMLRKFRGIDGLENESTKWEYTESFPQVSHQDVDWLWNGGVKRGLFRYGHMVKDFRIGTEALAKEHKLIVVTHRPERATNDTLEWVGHFFRDIPLFGFHMFSSRTEKTTVEWDLLIDDKPANVENAINHGRKAIIFDRAYNRDYPTSYRATWEGMEDVVAKALG